jgi:tetratricopeptide (TPR) repeat protein
VRAKNPSRRERLDLLARICDAVHHAHQRGVNHRDLKPDNILIDDSGVEPQPKILDFGVARVIDPAGQTTTLHTSVGQIVGTVAYMSPEQAGGNPDEIDTRADVYALGVIGYELLSGKLPYRVNQASVAESVRAIVQDEPAPLSTIDRSLRGDISTIVGKALEKDKSRRYPSAAELAADIRRFLRDEPIAAHAPSTFYQLQKFARRNKGLVAGIAAAFILLVLGVIGTSMGMIRANQAAAQARSETDKANAVNQFLNEMLASANPAELTATDRTKGRDVKVIDVLAQASAKLDAGSLSHQPLIEAAARRTIAITSKNLGDYATAERHLVRSLEIHRRLSGESHADVAEDLSLLAAVRHFQGKLDESEQMHGRAIELLKKVHGNESSKVADQLVAFGAVVRDKGRKAEAEMLFRQSLRILRTRYASQERKIAVALTLLASLLANEHRLAEAEPLHREALAIRRRLLGDEHPEVASSLQALGTCLYFQGKIDEAVELYESALSMDRKLLGDGHLQLTSSLNNLAVALRDRGRLADAEGMLRRCLAIEEATNGRSSIGCAVHLGNLGNVLRERGEFEEAEALFREALELVRRTHGEDHPSYCGALNNVGGLFREQKKFELAEPMFREALARRRKSAPDSAELVISLINYASTLRDLGRVSEAEPLAREGLEIAQRVLGEKHYLSISTRALVGLCLAESDRRVEAEPHLRGAYEAFVATLGPNHTRTTGLGYRLAAFYDLWNEPDKARAIRAALPSTQPSTTPVSQTP